MVFPWLGGLQLLYSQLHMCHYCFTYYKARLVLSQANGSNKATFYRPSSRNVAQFWLAHHTHAHNLHSLRLHVASTHQIITTKTEILESFVNLLRMKWIMYCVKVLLRVMTASNLLGKILQDWHTFLLDISPTLFGIHFQTKPGWMKNFTALSRDALMDSDPESDWTTPIFCWLCISGCLLVEL